MAVNKQKSTARTILDSYKLYKIRTHLQRWNPRPQYGGIAGSPTKLTYCWMTSSGVAPSKRWNSKIPPILRKVTLDPGKIKISKINNKNTNSIE